MPSRLIATVLTTFLAIALTAPAFAAVSNCKTPANDIEKLVCADPALLALDRKLDDVYRKALAMTAEKLILEGAQRDWLASRGTCSSAADRKACITERYQLRLAELQIQHGMVTAPTPVEFACNDNSKPFTAAFYNNLDPRAAVFTYGDEQVIALLAMSGSGSKYAADNFEYWEHQGEATVNFHGQQLTCKPRATR